MVTGFFADSGSVSVGGTEFKAEVTEISVGGGERDMTVVHTFTDEFANRAKQAPFETTISTVKQDTDLSRYVLGGAADTTWPITYSGATVTRTYPDIKYSFYENEDGTGSALRICFSGAVGVSKSMSVDSPEGYLTEAVTFKCIAKNYSEQWTGSDISGLV